MRPRTSERLRVPRRGFTSKLLCSFHENDLFFSASSIPRALSRVADAGWFNAKLGPRSLSLAVPFFLSLRVHDPAVHERGTETAYGTVSLQC
eukprot:2407934-Rhodomonas_salina.2